MTRASHRQTRVAVVAGYAAAAWALLFAVPHPICHGHVQSHRLLIVGRLQRWSWTDEPVQTPTA